MIKWWSDLLVSCTCTCFLLPRPILHVHVHGLCACMRRSESFVHAKLSAWNWSVFLYRECVPWLSLQPFQHWSLQNVLVLYALQLPQHSTQCFSSGSIWLLWELVGSNHACRLLEQTNLTTLILKRGWRKDPFLTGFTFPLISVLLFPVAFWFGFKKMLAGAGDLVFLHYLWGSLLPVSSQGRPFIVSRDPGGVPSQGCARF